MKQRTARVDGAGLLKQDVHAGRVRLREVRGRRRVLAYVKGAGGVRAIVEQLGLPTASHQ